MPLTKPPSNPAHSISYMLPAASLVKHGRLEEPKAAAAQLIMLTQSGRGECLLVALLRHGKGRVRSPL
jgi:hypothetical protein